MKRNKPYPYYDNPLNTDFKYMVNKRAEDEPDVVAIAYCEGKNVVEVTPTKYKADIEGLGTYLYSQGFHDVNIAIMGENSYGWVTAFLAVANGGNVSVCLDKDLPAEKKLQLLTQAECKAAFISDKYISGFEGVQDDENGKSLTLENGEKMTIYPMSEIPVMIEKGTAMIDGGDTSFVDYKVDPDKLATIFFTSGTTGQSKGVMLSQKNMAFDIDAACKNFILEGPSISALPYHHAFGLLTSFFAVYNYRYKVFINGNLRNVSRDIKNEKPQTLILVPLFVETFYKMIRSNIKKQNKEKAVAAAEKLSNGLLAVGIDVRKKLFKEIHEALGGNLEYIIAGGAYMDDKYVKAFHTWGIEILVGYGITECSPVLSVNRNLYVRQNSVGTALPGCEVKISPDGEIMTRGDQVMLGYYKNEEATAEVMKDGWFYTGDLGTIDDDGFIFITGRKKNLIILSNGENVSPEEIEEQFLKDDAVEEIIVSGEKGMLVAEIYPNEEHRGDQKYFDDMMDKWNKPQPQFKKIRKITLRDTEFEKNSTKKIIRYKK